MDGPDGMTGAKLRKLFSYAKAFGLTREDRLGLAEVLLRRDISSWSDLDDTQINRMLDALEGATLVMALMAQRPQP